MHSSADFRGVNTPTAVDGLWLPCDHPTQTCAASLLYLHGRAKDLRSRHDREMRGPGEGHVLSLHYLCFLTSHVVSLQRLCLITAVEHC